jgi:transcriptional regulator with XRE-family HTH domain
METGIQGHRVRQLREDMHWTQEDLSKRVNAMVGAINQSSISNVERGGKGMRVDALAALAVVLQTSTDYLLGLTDDPEPRTALENEVLLIVNDPVRREYLQRLFTAIEQLPTGMRDEYWKAIALLYDGLVAREYNERRSAAVGRRNILKDT